MTDGDDIPERSRLIEQIRRANRLAVPWVFIQVGLIIGLVLSIKWERLLDDPLISVIAVLFVIGLQLWGILRYCVVNKREISALNEHTRFGEFDKSRLRTLVDETLDRLDLPRPGPPVYITSDRSINAGTLHLGMGGFFRSMNGVYLNRQILHRLTPAEVQHLVGHELGHFYRYYLISQQFQGLALLLGALGALFVAQRVGMSNILSLLALTAVGSACWIVSGWLHARNAMAIEFLCDDFGAQVNGVVVSINGLLKSGADDELHLAIQHQQLASRKNQYIGTNEVIEAIQAAIPFGHTSREELERAVADSVKRSSYEHRQRSFPGFLRQVWNTDESECKLEEFVQRIDLVQKIPRIAWEAILDTPGRIELDEQKVVQLVALIDGNPGQLLFRSLDEFGELGSIHPPIRKRIQYLWANRLEIAVAAAQVRLFAK